MILYEYIKVMIRSDDGDTVLFDIVTGFLKDVH